MTLDSAPKSIITDISTIKERGKSIRDYWFLEEGLTYLNHGAYGSLPRQVHEAANEWRLHVEKQPARFIQEELPFEIRKAADKLAEFVGANGDDIVFIDNATTAVNAVLRSLVLLPGDEIVTSNHVHGSVLRTLEFICERAGARLHQAHIPFPIYSAEDATDAVTSRLSPRTRLVVIDHITSLTALKLPLENIISECEDRAIPVLVDGAHAPGFVELNLNRLGASWYVGNCHKWLGAPKGCAFLWTKTDLQNAVRPTTISLGISDGYTQAFDWPGTKDFSPYLSINSVLAFRERFGEENIRSYCHGLIMEAAKYLATLWGTDRGAPEEMTGNMTTVAWPGSEKATQANADKLRSIFRDEYKIEIEPKIFSGRIWIRICAYLYNEMEDYKKLGTAALDIIEKGKLRS